MAILTLNSPYQEINQLTHQTIKQYAIKLGQDFIILPNLTYDTFQKLDEDIHIFISPYCIVREDTPDLFTISEKNKFHALKESRFNIIENLQIQCKNNNIAYTHYSLDVVCFDKNLTKFFIEGQEVFNLFIAKHYKELMQDLPYKYNRIHEMDIPSGEPRHASYIINYISMAQNPQLMLDTIKKDLQVWKDNPTHEYKQYIALLVDGCGLGDVTCTEPVARYAKEKLYPNQNFCIVTDKPEFFTHLGVPIYGNKDKVPNSYNYFTMKCFGDLEDPIQGKYLSHPSMHCIDFCSMMAYRRQIPYEDRTITLTDYTKDEETMNSLATKVDISFLKRAVLVHAGRHWPSKTFPDYIWEQWTQEINKANIPIVRVGKTIEKGQGVVDFILPDNNTVDLVDKLNLKELIACIQLCPIIFTNDSAPIHIAGATDNWIVTILTCKEKEYVMPFRKGGQTYKTTVFNRMVFDTEQHRPNQIDGFKIDQCPLDKLLSVLPTKEEIVKAIKEAYDSQTNQERYLGC